MDFVTHLPETPLRFDTITTFVNRLNCVNFVPSHATAFAKDVANCFFEHEFKPHWLLDSIMSDRDPKFSSKFCGQLMELCVVKLKVPSSKHPQKMDVMNRMLQTIPDVIVRFLSAMSQTTGPCRICIQLGVCRVSGDFLLQSRHWMESVFPTRRCVWPLRLEDSKRNGSQATTVCGFRDTAFAHRLAQAQQAVHTMGDVTKCCHILWATKYS